ncbi:MAG TPA: hypothetical protein PLF13_03715 [candidate division Zixibacteria bacterium]|nr:hypothetical protein [candidate division Zixibacteria bacterium]
MKRLSFLTVTAIILLGLLWAVGCDDSDDSVGSSLPEGDTNDINYQFMTSEVFDEQFLSGIDLSLLMSTMLIDSIPNVTAVGHTLSPALSMDEDDNIFINTGSYANENGWHVFNVDGYMVIYDWNSNDTIDFVGIDSIQVLANDSVKYVPDSTIDELRYRVHIDMDSRSDNLSRSAVHSVNMERIAGGDDMVEINGTFVESAEAEVSDGTTTCSLMFGSNVTANGIELDLSADDCPQAGSLSATVTVNLSCAGSNSSQLDVNGTWTVTASYNGVTEKVVISDGTNQWTHVEDCGGN